MPKSKVRKYKDLTKNTILFAISSFGTKILSFLLVPLYTNILTTSEYGTADILMTTTTLLIVVLTINIADGVLIFAMDKNYRPVEILAFGIKVIVGGESILVVLCVICNLSKIIHWPIYYYMFVCGYFAVSALYQTLSNYLRAIDKVREVAIGGIVSSIVYIAFNILLLLGSNMGLYGYLVATIMGPFISSLYCIYVANVSIRQIMKQHNNAEQIQAMVKYCFPLVFNSIALWINSCLDRYFVTYFCGVEQNGIYSVASKIPVILSTFYTVFSQAWTLSAVKEFDPEDKDSFFSNMYEVYNAAMSIVCSALILINIPLAKGLYAKDFFIAWKYSSVLLLGIFFNSLTAFIGSFFSATRKSNILAITTVVSAIINTFLNIVLIPKFGVQGAAVATAIALALMWFIRMLKLRGLIRLKIHWLRDFAVYILLCLQIIAEHQKGHMYLEQILIACIIIVLFNKPIIKIGRKVKIIIANILDR